MEASSLVPLPPRLSAVEACAAAVREAILRGELGEGSRLPPERALSERLGVNRTTLRAALRELESGGLLRVKQGSGYVVRAWRESAGPGLVPDLVVEARARGELVPLCADLLDVRRRLAAAVLERLERRAHRAEALAALDERVRRFVSLAEQAPPATSAALAAADVEILHALVGLSGSSVLGLFLNPVLGVLGALPELRDAIYAEPLGNAEGYRALMAHLYARAEGDTTLAMSPAELGALLELRDRDTLARLEARVRGELRTSRGEPR